MKKILIHAYTNVNLGDDLFVKILCERYPKHQFYMICSERNKKPFLEIKNLKLISYPPILEKVIYKFQMHEYISRFLSRNCDGVVNIGGSIFMEPSDWRKSTSRFSKIANVKTPFFVLGSNFGPYSSEKFYNAYKKQFSSLEDVCFRDQYSFNLFSDLSNVRMAPDIVFTLKKEMVTKNKLNNNVVISVMNLENRKGLSKYTSQYENKIKEISISLINKGYKVTLMSFCEHESDTIAIKRISSSMPAMYNDDLHAYNYDGDLNNTLSIIKSSQGVIATRFHSMILAWIFKLPVYPIIYSEKTQNVLRDSNFKGESSWIDKISGIDVDKVVSQVINGEIHKIDNEIEKAHNQFLKLDEILN